MPATHLPQTHLPQTDRDSGGGPSGFTRTHGISAPQTTTYKAQGIVTTITTVVECLPYERRGALYTFSLISSSPNPGEVDTLLSHLKNEILSRTGELSHSLESWASSLRPCCRCSRVKHGACPSRFPSDVEGDRFPHLQG